MSPGNSYRWSWCCVLGHYWSTRFKFVAFCDVCYFKILPDINASLLVMYIKLSLYEHQNRKFFGPFSVVCIKCCRTNLFKSAFECLYHALFLLNLLSPLLSFELLILVYIISKPMLLWERNHQFYSRTWNTFQKHLITNQLQLVNDLKV